MAELKTKPTNASVTTFIDSIENETRRKDAKALVKMMREVTGLKPRMWGPSMIGFGSYDYTYDSGHSGTCAIIAFAPRKTSSVLYLLPGFDAYDDLLAKLGPHKTGVSCLYVTKLEKVDTDVLRELVQRSFEHIVATNPGNVTLK